MFISIAVYLAATSSNDFMALSSVPLTFSPGSGNGAIACTNLVAMSDNLVEGKEDFRLSLVQITSGTSLSLANNSTAVSLIDGDGMFHIFTYLLLVTNYSSFFSCLLFSKCRCKCY